MLSLIGSEKDIQWPGILNDIDNEILGVLKSWAQVAMSWPIILPNNLVQYPA